MIDHWHAAEGRRILNHLPTKGEIVEHLRSGGRVEWMAVETWGPIYGSADQWAAGHPGGARRLRHADVPSRGWLTSVAEPATVTRMEIKDIEDIQKLAEGGAIIDLVTKTGTCPGETFIANEAMVRRLAGKGWVINLV